MCYRLNVSCIWMPNGIANTQTTSLVFLSFFYQCDVLFLASGNWKKKKRHQVKRTPIPPPFHHHTCLCLKNSRRLLMLKQRIYLSIIQPTVFWVGPSFEVNLSWKICITKVQSSHIRKINCLRCTTSNVSFLTLHYWISFWKANLPQNSSTPVKPHSD